VLHARLTTAAPGNVRYAVAVTELSEGEINRPMVAWKLLALAFKVQRRQLLENAGKQARKHGPVLAQHVSSALRNARKGS
jgi:chaperonin GroEL (HSP60 family)